MENTQPINANKPSHKKLIMILSVLVILALSFVSYTKVKSNYNNYIYNESIKNYNKGISDGQTNIINQINEKGLIPIIYNNTIQNVPIQTLCEAIK